MRKNSLLLLLILSCRFVSAQKTIPEFGVIDKADLQMQSCAFEPDATAMKLFDVQESEFLPSAFDDKVRTVRRVRIKIFNEKGFQFATVKVPYYDNKSSTKISDLRGIVYSLDNNENIITSKIEEADFIKDKFIDKVGLLSFTFPNLRAGSVIEYTYTFTEKSSDFDSWELPSVLPALYLSNTLIYPTYATLKEYKIGNPNVSRKNEVLKKGIDKNKTTFFAENIASLNDEPYMSCYIDNAPRMLYNLIKLESPIVQDFGDAWLWREWANDLVKSSFFEDQFKKLIPGTEKIVDTAKTMVNISDRVKYLYGVVKRRIPESDEQTHVPDNIVEAWKSHTASTAEMNMILMNLLKRSNVKCHPVMVSTRDHGKIDVKVYTESQFNGLDVFVDDQNAAYLIDASLRYQPFNIPPQNILNRDVFILDPDNIRWARITDDRPLYRQSTNIFANLTKEGKVEAGATINFFDYAKSLFLDSASSQDIKDNRLIDKKMEGLKMLTDNRENMGDGEPLVQSVEFDYETQESGNFYFINPKLLALKKTNPFLAEKRTTDIDFGANQRIEITMHLGLPDNFQVEGLPKSIVVRSPDSSFAFTRITYFDASNISFTQTLEIRKAVFDKNEYAGLFEFFKRIFALMSEEIVLKKK